MDKNSPKILLLVEGAKTDVRLMKHLLDVYGISKNHEIVSYNTNIYTLYKEMFVDNSPDTMDVLQLLKEKESDPVKKQIFDVVYSDILLIFDLDPQDNLFSAEKIKEMLNYFNESSDMGKLYINYPMVESFYHMTEIPDKDFNERNVTMSELYEGSYKTRVNRENRNHDYTKFAVDKNECDIVISQNIHKGLIISGESYSNALPNESSILTNQLKSIEERRELSVLCTCSYYIYDYNSNLIELRPM